MKIAEVAVRRPIATAMFFTALTVMGLFAYRNLQVDLFPKMDFPSITVMTTYQGVAPEEIENLITRPIESAISRVEGVDKIESYSVEGRSRVSLRFEWGKDLEVAVNDVRGALDRVRGVIPTDADNPIIFKFDLSTFPVMNLGLSSNMDEGRLRQFADDVVVPRFERMPGVAQVDLRGARKREIRIEIEPERLTALEIGLTEVTAALRNHNLQAPAGRVYDGRDNVLVRAMGEFEDLETIMESPVAWRDGTTIRISDIGAVVDDFQDHVNIVRVNGTHGVQLIVTASPDANTIEVADMLYAEIERFNRDYDGAATIDILFDSSTYIRQSLAGVTSAVGYGAGLALIVLLLFLQSVRSTIVIGVAIPISVVATFFLMQQLDLTLNLISFGGLAIGVGMLVDNSIVILENIFRHRELGADRDVAAIEGAREVGAAVIASTITTVCAFVPVVFLGGFAALFFNQMTLVVVATLGCSLLVALTLVPVLSSIFLPRLKEEDDPSKHNIIRKALDGIDNTYGRSISWTLRWPWVPLVLSGATLWFAMGASDQIGRELMPESDEGEVRINAQYPVGTRIEATENATAVIEEIIAREIPEALSVLSNVGTPGNWSNAGEESSTIRINLPPAEERARSSEEIAAALRPHLAAELPGMQIFARAGGGLWIFSFLRGGDDRVRVEIRGFDLEDSSRLAREVSQLVQAQDGVADVNISRRTGGRELQLFIDRERAADYGVSVRALTEGISLLVQGQLAGYYRERGDEYEIRVKLQQEDLRDLDRVLEVPISLPRGGSVALRELVSVETGRTPLSIDRLNQERIVNVTAGLDGTRSLGDVNASIQEALQSLQVPEDFAVILTGEAEQQDETFGGLMIGIMLALMLVYMVMAGQFESFLQPLVIMLSVPFAAIGVIGALLFFDSTLNINSLMGVIVLVGVVVNNGIILIDYTNLLRREQGFELREAVVEAARRRLRPILMTTTTTVLALLPIAMATGSGSESQGPLAQVVVGGLLSNTVVTLFIVPVLYLWTESVSGVVKGWIAKREGT